MSAKWKTREGPRKLNAFCSPAGIQRDQDGTSCSPPCNTEKHAAGSEQEGDKDFTPQCHSNTDSQDDILSPVKQRRRISSNEGKTTKAPSDHNYTLESNPYDDKLNAIPTAGQPILDTTIKDMIMSLRGALQHDMINFMHKSKVEIEALGERVDYMENKMCDFTSAHNDLVDSHFELHSLKTEVGEII